MAGYNDVENFLNKEYAKAIDYMDAPSASPLNAYGNAVPNSVNAKRGLRYNTQDAPFLVKQAMADQFISKTNEELNDLYNVENFINTGKAVASVPFDVAKGTGRIALDIALENAVPNQMKTYGDGGKWNVEDFIKDVKRFAPQNIFRTAIQNNPVLTAVKDGATDLETYANFLFPNSYRKFKGGEDYDAGDVALDIGEMLPFVWGIPATYDIVSEDLNSEDGSGINPYTLAKVGFMFAAPFAPKIYKAVKPYVNGAWKKTAERINSAAERMNGRDITERAIRMMPGMENPRRSTDVAVPRNVQKTYGTKPSVPPKYQLFDKDGKLLLQNKDKIFRRKWY